VKTKRALRTCACCVSAERLLPPGALDSGWSFAVVRVRKRSHSFPSPPHWCKDTSDDLSWYQSADDVYIHVITISSAVKILSSPGKGLLWSTETKWIDKSQRHFSIWSDLTCLYIGLFLKKMIEYIRTFIDVLMSHFSGSSHGALQLVLQLQPSPLHPHSKVSLQGSHITQASHT